MAQIRLGNTPVEVVFKDIKNVHLTVHPPEGRVRIAAPTRMTLDRVRLFAIAKLGWIRKQQAELRAQEREPRRKFIPRESLYLWGRRYLLAVEEADRPATVDVLSRRIRLTVRPGTSLTARTAVMEAWYRDQVREALPGLLGRWERVVGASAGRVSVRRMKTRWGSCNHGSGSILLNTELAKKPPECLEYVLVHELVHLLEPTHNTRFVTLMDEHMPAWRHYRRVLNRLPIRQEAWTY